MAVNIRHARAVADELIKITLHGPPPLETVMLLAEGVIALSDRLEEINIALEAHPDSELGELAEVLNKNNVAIMRENNILRMRLSILEGKISSLRGGTG